MTASQAGQQADPTVVAAVVRIARERQAREQAERELELALAAGDDLWVADVLRRLRAQPDQVMVVRCPS